MKPITITVTAETAEAAAKLEKFIIESGAGLHQLAEHGHEANESFHQAREGAMLAREGMNTLSEVAEKLGAEKMTALASNVLLAREALLTARSSAMLFGTTLTAMVPWLAVAGGAVAAGALVWHTFADAEKRAVEQTNEFGRACKELPELLKQINEAQSAGLLTAQSREQLLAGVGLGENTMARGSVSDNLRSLAGVAISAPVNPTLNAQSPLKFDQNPLGLPDPADIRKTQEELFKLGILLKEVDEKGHATFFMNPAVQAMRELTEMRKNDAVVMATGFDKERAEAKKTHEEELKQLDEKFRQSMQLKRELESRLSQTTDPNVGFGLKNQIDQLSLLNKDDLVKQLDFTFAQKNEDIDKRAAAKKLEEARRLAEEQNRVREAAYAEGKKQIEALEHEITLDADKEGQMRGQFAASEFARRAFLLNRLLVNGQISTENFGIAMDEAQHKANEGLKEYRIELEKIAATKQEISRADLEAQIKRVESDKTLTTPEKNAQLDPFYAKQILALDEAIAEAQKLINDGKTDQLELTKKIHALERERQDVIVKRQDTKDSSTVSGNFTEQWTSLSNKVGNLSQDMAKFAMSPFEGMRQGLASAFDQLLEKGTTFKKFMGTIAMDIGRSMIQAFSNMVADWIMSHIVMAGVSAAWHALVTGQQAAATSAQVGIHTAGEAAKTGATAAGAGTRAGIGWLEVTWHAIQTGIKVVAHALGEAAMTAWSFIQSIIRRGIVFLELQPWIIMAGIEAAAAVAGIPVVGPILAPIAAATTIAGLEALAVFSDGGYTGPGGVFEPAGIVHRGEYVFSQASVQRIGLPVLEAMHNGSNAGAGSGGGSPMAAGGNDNIHVYGFTDPNKLMDHFHKSDAHRAFIVDVMSEQAHKLSR